MHCCRLQCRDQSSCPTSIHSNPRDENGANTTMADGELKPFFLSLLVGVHSIPRDVREMR